MTDVACPRTTIQPGALTALLGELARAPEASGWSVPAVPGETIGRFEIVREIGRGGFGVVYEARDTELGRSVAFKTIRAGSSDAARELRAVAEAEAAARLAHPNIVHLYDLGRCERGAFLIMELLHGESLDDRLSRGPFKLRDAIHVAAEIARGLAHAHDQGVVHRDLKPGNVFLCDDGQVKVLDFGLAHVFGRGGISGGTPAYMAPEQARGEPSDARADVYALGVMIHELVTGRRPFEDGERGVPPGGKGPDLPGAPAALARLAARMLSPEPAGRPASAVEAHAELAAIRRSLEPKRLLWAGVAVAAVAVACAGAFAWLWQRPLPPGRLLTAIADTTNPTGEPELDAASDLLRPALEQSMRVSVMARARLLNALVAGGAAAPPLLSEAPAREAARHEAAQVLLVPAVQRAGDGYALSVKAIDLSRNDLLFDLTERLAAKASLAAAVDRVSARLRVALREDPRDAPARPVSTAEAISSDPEVLRWYAEGMRLWSEGRGGAAGRAFEKVLERDPEVPMAHLLAGFAQANPDDGRRHWEAARRGMHRAPALERALIEAIAGLGVTDEERVRLLQNVIARWPEEPIPYQLLGILLIHRFGDVEAARPYLEKALRIASLSPREVIRFLIALGRLDEALQRARRWAEAHPGWPPPLLAEANLRLHRGELGAALDAARRAVAAGGRMSVTLRWVYVEAGDLAGVEEALARGLVEPPPLWQPDAYPHAAPAWLALTGRCREALAVVRARTPLPGAPPSVWEGHQDTLMGILAACRRSGEEVWRAAEVSFRHGGQSWVMAPWLLAELGDVDGAERAARAAVVLGGVEARLYRDLVDWRRGHREQALQDLAGVYGHASAFYRGAILAELGRDREAVEAFRGFRRAPAAPEEPAGGDGLWWLGIGTYPRSLVLEAEALDRLGERDEATRTLDRFFQLWARADPDHPTLREATALRTRLEGEASR